MLAARVRWDGAVIVGAAEAIAARRGQLVEFEDRDKGILAMSSEETRQEKTIINTVIDITNFGIV